MEGKMLEPDFSLENSTCFYKKNKLKIVFIDSPLLGGLDKTQKQYLFSLKGKKINDLPIVGTYLQNKCILEDISIEDNTICYWFNLEREIIKIIDNFPKKIVEHHKLECRHFMNKNILVLSLIENLGIKDISSMLALIPEALRIKVYPDSAIRYCKPKISEVSLEHINMEIFKSFLFTLIKIDSREDIEKEIFNVNNLLVETSLDKPALKLKASIGAKGRQIQFSYKSPKGINEKLVVRSNGEVQCSTGISTKLIFEISEIFFLLSKVNNASEFLISIDGILEEYFQYIHKDMAEEAKIRQKRLIFRELIDFFEAFCEENLVDQCLSNTYITIIINIIIYFSRGTNLMDISVSESMELLDYSNLIRFITVYTNKSFQQHKVEEKIVEVLSAAGYLLKRFGKREDKILNFIDERKKI
jgi:hypothetical protein